MEKFQILSLLEKHLVVEKTTWIRIYFEKLNKKTVFKTFLLILFIVALMWLISDKSFEFNQFFITKSDLKIKLVKIFHDSS